MRRAVGRQPSVSRFPQPVAIPEVVLRFRGSVAIMGRWGGSVFSQSDVGVSEIKTVETGR
jgi:hypothetical protein